MDNENSYKELVKNFGCLLKLKSVKESGVIPVDDVRKLIPELNESENERIKRCIQVALTDVDEKRFRDYDTTLKECIAWIEKQGEKNHWKPSEEQLRAIINSAQGLYQCKEKEVLLNLYEQLKNL